MRPSRIPHRISKILFALGANELLVMLEGKIRVTPFFKVQSGKETVWIVSENGISYLYSIWEVLQCIWSNLWYSYDGEMKSQMESNMKGLRATYNVFFLTFFIFMPSSTVQCIEVQVCTFLQHIWSNVQLSMGYLLKEFSEFHVGENIVDNAQEIQSISYVILDK